jgi:tetratricopeptide (TPR) repeat protein
MEYLQNLDFNSAIAYLALVVSFISYRQNRKASKVSNDIQQKQQLMGINIQLEEAWTLLGGNIEKDGIYNFGKPKELNTAYRIIERCELTNPKYDKIYWLKGLYFVGKKRVDLAIEMYTKALELNPKNYLAYNNLANALSRLEKHDEAIKHYKKSNDINPNFTTAIVNLANLHQKIDQHAEAIELYRHALTQESEDEIIYNHLGISLVKLKNFSKAEEAYIKAIELNDKYSYPYSNLADLYVIQKEKGKALNMIKKALKIRPDNNYAKELLKNIPSS